MPAWMDHPLVKARLAVAFLAIAPLYFLATPTFDGDVLLAGMGHAVLNSLMAVVALITAAFVSRAAWQRHDIRAALVASGFTATGGMLLVHALATPGGPIFHDVTATVGFAGVMSMPIGAGFIAIAMSISSRAGQTRRLVVQVQCATLFGAVGFAAVGLLAPHRVPQVPLMDAPYSTIVLAASIPTLLLAALRVHRVADITRRPSDAAMFTGILALAMAVSSYVQSVPFDTQFWLGHFLEAIALTCISVGIVGDLRRPMSAWRLTTHRDGRAVVESSEELLGGFVHALTVRLAEVDPSTWHHSRRVAELAVEVGEQLELDAPTIRRIAAAGLVHDIGKLRIPHSVLHKAGKLTDEEFDLVKAHPDFGVELLSQLRGFDGELMIVLGHHEKLSGTGYPLGLKGEQIDLETRIMTACDVFDALTDSRSYKEPWPVERALALLHEESGTSFDPIVVQALESVIVRRLAQGTSAGIDAASAAHAQPEPVVPIFTPAIGMQPIDGPAGLLPDRGALERAWDSPEDLAA
ncbi:MAG: hypothetical protein JWL76_1494 [Thermoleophilia bacterium]|nr:hypothetical protein [Thermoleophilia bacterium]